MKKIIKMIQNNLINKLIISNNKKKIKIKITKIIINKLMMKIKFN